MTPATPEALLKTVFGYDTFKPLQREVIENVLQRRDTMVIMPTGGGKSLCYQIPALIFPGLTVVVSPLIALMKDQVEQMREIGVPAVFLNSSLSLDEYRSNVAKVRGGQVKLLYVAPETLLLDRTIELLSSVPLDCLTIDEAHCISEWGHDFRPEYRQIVTFRKRFPHMVCVALTATATPRVREDIQRSLHFETSNEFLASFNRENLMIEVVQKTDGLRQTLDFLKRLPNQSGIIYCFSRRQVDELAAALASRKFSVRPYHAGLEDAERRRNQELFIRDDVQIIVATIAFGMGINKPNVRFVIHFDLPKSIEGYYQEIGRAGRDGLPAVCMLLFSYSDIQKQKFFIDQKEGQERQVAYQHLSALVRYAESPKCRRGPLLNYFGEEYTRENCAMCDRCLSGARTEVDITIPAQKFLSCVRRTGEKFGMVHVIDVLLGSENQKVIKYGHHLISTHGIGKDLSRPQWMNIARQLVQKGLLNQDEEHGSLSLTPEAYQALVNRDPIFGVLAEETPASSGGAGGSYDRDLFDILRGKRKALADKAGIPPYIIFSDRTLTEMATYFPTSRDSLAKINGVGAVKLERYGETFLELVRAYVKHKGITEREREPARRAKPAAGLDGLRKPRHVAVGEAFNSGQSVQALMESYGVHINTILDHLSKYALEGKPLRSDDSLASLSPLSEERQQQVIEAFAAEGAEYLRPVFDRFQGAVSFDDLKILRLRYLCLTQGENRENPV